MADEVDHMLTTIDNPWNPYTDYDEWLAYDRSLGYDTPGYLARIVKTSNDLSDTDNEEAIESAISEICELNINGLYRSVANPQTISKTN